jgi:hypothetical protein
VTEPSTHLSGLIRRSGSQLNKDLAAQARLNPRVPQQLLGRVVVAYVHDHYIGLPYRL